MIPPNHISFLSILFSRKILLDLLLGKCLRCPYGKCALGKFKSPIIVLRFSTTMANLNKTRRFCFASIRYKLVDVYFHSVSVAQFVSIFVVRSSLSFKPFHMAMYVFRFGIIMCIGCDCVVPNVCVKRIFKEEKKTVHSFHFDSFIAFLVVLCWNISIKAE